MIAGIVQRGPQDNAPVDRNELKLERQSLAVAVEPCRSDLGPVCFFALVGDVPGEEVGCLGFAYPSGGPRLALK